MFGVQRAVRGKSKGIPICTCNFYRWSKV